MEKFTTKFQVQDKVMLLPPEQMHVTSYVQRSGRHFQKNAVKNLLCTDKYVSRDSSVGIATHYLLDGPGSNPGGAVFRTRPDWLCSLLYDGYRVIPGF